MFCARNVPARKQHTRLSADADPTHVGGVGSAWCQSMKSSGAGSPTRLASYWIMRMITVGDVGVVLFGGQQPFVRADVFDVVAESGITYKYVRLRVPSGVRRFTM